jgi:uncharacterized protein HemX
MEPNTTPNQNMNNMGTPPQMTETPTVENKNTIGPVIGIVIIIAVIILGGLYFWMVRGNNEQTEQATNQPQQQTTTQTASTDSVSDLDASLKATNVDNVDASLSDVDAAFAQ